MVTSTVTVVVMGVLDPIKRKKLVLQVEAWRLARVHIAQVSGKKKASIFLLRPFPDRCDQWM